MTCPLVAIISPRDFLADEPNPRFLPGHTLSRPPPYVTPRYVTPATSLVTLLAAHVSGTGRMEAVVLSPRLTSSCTPACVGCLWVFG